MNKKEILKQALCFISKIVGFLLLYACLCFLTAPFAYGAFANAFKAQFNTTQTEATILESVVSLSSLFMVPNSLVYETHGVLTTAIASLVISSFGWSSVWILSLLKTNIIHYQYVLWIAMAVAVHGGGYISILSLAYAPLLVAPNYQTNVVTAMVLSTDIGTFAYSFIYESCFVNGHVLDPENQSLNKFLLFVLILGTLAGVLLVAALPLTEKYRYVESSDKCGVEKYCDEFTFITESCNVIIPEDISISGKFAECVELVSNVQNNANSQLSRASSVTASTPLLPDDSASSHGYIQLFFELRFQLLLLSLSIPLGVAAFTPYNLTYMTQSLSFQFLDYYLVTTHRIIMIASKFVVLLILTLARRFTYTIEVILLVFNVLLVSFHILFALFADHEVFFLLSFIASALTYGAMTLMLPISINLYYGDNKFAFRFGVTWSTTCILLCLLNILFGTTYDSDRQMHSDGDSNCYGIHCITLTYIVMSVCGMLATLTTTGLFYLKYQKNEIRNRTFH